MLDWDFFGPAFDWCSNVTTMKYQPVRHVQKQNFQRKWSKTSSKILGSTDKIKEQSMGHSRGFCIKEKWAVILPSLPQQPKRGVKCMPTPKSTSHRAWMTTGEHSTLRRRARMQLGMACLTSTWESRSNHSGEIPTVLLQVGQEMCGCFPDVGHVGEGQHEDALIFSQDAVEGREGPISENLCPLNIWKDQRAWRQLVTLPVTSHVRTFLPYFLTSHSPEFWPCGAKLSWWRSEWREKAKEHQATFPKCRQSVLPIAGKQ